MPGLYVLGETRALSWLALTMTDDLRPALAVTAAVLVALGGRPPLEHGH